MTCRDCKGTGWVPRGEIVIGALFSRNYRQCPACREAGWYWVRWGGEGEWLMLHYDGDLWWSDGMPLLPGLPDDAEISARIDPPTKERQGDG